MCPKAHLLGKQGSKWSLDPVLGLTGAGEGAVLSPASHFRGAEKTVLFWPFLSRHSAFLHVEQTDGDQK